MILTTYLLCSLVVALFWSGLALLCGAPLAWALIVFTLALPLAFITLMFIGGAGAGGQHCDQMSYEYFINQDLE